VGRLNSQSDDSYVWYWPAHRSCRSALFKVKLNHGIE
jgi:hypothetical protein